MNLATISIILVVVLACVAVEAWTPPTYNQSTINCFNNKTLLNPFPSPPAGWNPYNNASGPGPWVDKVCAVVYPNEPDRSKYLLKTFDNKSAAEAAGAFVTHLHPCGYCSTLHDLAVYLAKPDLTNPGRRCGLEGVIDEQWSVKCFQEIGFTPPCAIIWALDAQNTRKHCFDICIKAWIEKWPNNIPANSTNMNPCIACDEYKSGPYFKHYAARTRRDSGLISSINRPASEVYHVIHDYC